MILHVITTGFANPAHFLLYRVLCNQSDLAPPERKATINPFPHFVGPEAGHRERNATTRSEINDIPLLGLVET